MAGAILLIIFILFVLAFLLFFDILRVSLTYFIEYIKEVKEFVFNKEQRKFILGKKKRPFLLYAIVNSIFYSLVTLLVFNVIYRQIYGTGVFGGEGVKGIIIRTLTILVPLTIFILSLLRKNLSTLLIFLASIIVFIVIVFVIMLLLVEDAIIYIFQ